MKSEQPLVSILAANYNNSRYVIDTLDSLAAQTYQNIELIIVDDASTDDSPEKIKEWLKGYNKPNRFLVHDFNKGICATCNDLVKNASGKYLSFIATDDMYMPDKIKNQVAQFENLNNDYALLYSDVYLMDEVGNRRNGTYMSTLCNIENPPSGNIVNELQKINFLHWISVLVKKEVFDVVGLYDESLPFEDYDMSVRIAKKYLISYDPHIQTLYRTHAQSFSGKAKNWDELLLTLYLKHNDLTEFKLKSESIILNKYLHRQPDAKKMALKYNSVTGRKIKYNFFIVNNIPPMFMKIYRKAKEFTNSDN